MKTPKIKQRIVVTVVTVYQLRMVLGSKNVVAVTTRRRRKRRRIVALTTS
jgi:hypothetical protein